MIIIVVGCRYKLSYFIHKFSSGYYDYCALGVDGDFKTRSY